MLQQTSVTYINFVAIQIHLQELEPEKSEAGGGSQTLFNYVMS